MIAPTAETVKREQSPEGDRAAACRPPAPGVVHSLNDEVRSGWAEFLSRYQWDVFATLTYANFVYSGEKIVRDFNRWLWLWQVKTAEERGACVVTYNQRHDGYGRLLSTKMKVRGTWWNNYRKKRGLPVWVLGIENHQSGALHAHAIIRWSSLLPDLERRLGWRLWKEPNSRGGLGMGWAKIEPPRSQDDVSGYVSKYVVKGGDIVLSPSFNAHRLVAA